MSRNHGGWPRIALAVLAALIIGRDAPAQNLTTGFAEEPILVLDTGAHHAPVRRLAFTADERRLLSAGEDKVVRVWDLGANPPGLDWTIRPPIWRGPAGSINAMALAPPDAQGRQALALGGFGVEASRGEIGLYTSPGADRRPGDFEGYLYDARYNSAVPLEQSKGHRNPVACLAFHPSGTFLASGGNDRTVRLWDRRARAQLDVKAPAGQGNVNALAFSPDGRLLITGGSDGILRAWDVTARTLGPFAEVAAWVDPRRPGNVDGRAINALDVSRDGRFAVIGREDGFLIRYEVATLAAGGGRMNFELRPGQGAVEGLTLGPGGALVCSTIAREIAATGDRPTVACEIELLDVLQPRGRARLASTADLAYALAFSRSGKYLAYAGGDRQDVAVIQFQAPGRPIIDLTGTSGRGASVWNVGFADNTSLAFSYARPDANPTPWSVFDIADRARAPGQPQAVRTAIREYDGWTVRPKTPYSLEILRGGVVAAPLDLNPGVDQRWWDYTFLPPGPRHPVASLAVACQNGSVVIYRLSDFRRTRVLAGHEAAVRCLAPSADGKWLATGSADQTVRLWSLAGCDEVAPLGATFELGPGGRPLIVKSVAKAGFADIAGLRAGDLIDTPAIGPKTPPPADFLRDFAAAPPYTPIQFEGRRKRPDGPEVDVPVLVGTTKRDRPALSLFVGEDREWVVWMPGGFYDASVAGDSTFLGWQVNGPAFGPVPGRTDFFPLLTHEKKLRQPRGVPGNAIDALLASGDEAAALGTRPAGSGVLVDADRPSRVTPVVAAGGAEVRTVDGRVIAVGSPLPPSIRVGPGTLAVNWLVETWKNRPQGTFAIKLSGETIRAAQAPPAPPPGATVAVVPMRVEVGPGGSYTFAGQADGGGPNERVEAFTATVDGQAATKEGRLRLLAIAPTFADPALKPILKTLRDVEELVPFLNRSALGRSGLPFSKSGPAVERILVGEGATGPKVLAALDLADGGPIGPDDLAVVLIETYVLTAPVGQALESRLVVAESRGSPPSRETTIPAEAISSALEGLAHRGCRVVLILDGAHRGLGAGSRSNVVEWARDLRNHRDVVTILATIGRPFGDEHVGANRPLASALLESTRLKNPLSLSGLRSVLLEDVQRRTRREGEPEIYIPRGIDAGAPFLGRVP